MSKNKGLNPGHMLIFAIIVWLLILFCIFIFKHGHSFETFLDSQVERKKEWNKKNYEFMGRDRNGDGILTGEEIETEF